MRWPLDRWDIHRLRRALQRAIEEEQLLQNSGEADPTHRIKSKREAARWRVLDFKLSRMLDEDARRRK